MLEKNITNSNIMHKAIAIVRDRCLLTKNSLEISKKEKKLL